MELFTITIILLIIYFIHKICNRKEDIIEGAESGSSLESEATCMHGPLRCSGKRNWTHGTRRECTRYCGGARAERALARNICLGGKVLPQSQIMYRGRLAPGERRQPYSVRSCNPALYLSNDATHHKQGYRKAILADFCDAQGHIPPARRHPACKPKRRQVQGQKLNKARTYHRTYWEGRLPPGGRPWPGRRGRGGATCQQAYKDILKTTNYNMGKTLNWFYRENENKESNHKNNCIQKRWSGKIPSNMPKQKVRRGYSSSSYAPTKFAVRGLPADSITYEDHPHKG